MEFPFIKQLLEAEKEIRSVTIKGFDRLVDEFILPFDAEVTYTVEDLGVENHPYGSTTAQEPLGFEVEVKTAVSLEEIKKVNSDEKVIQTWPAGTELRTLPGWSVEHEKELEEDCENDWDNR